MANRSELRLAILICGILILPSLLISIGNEDFSQDGESQDGIGGDGGFDSAHIESDATGDAGRVAFTGQPRLGLTQWGGGDGLGVVNCTNLQLFAATEVWMLVYWVGINETGAQGGSNWSIVDEMVQDAEDCGVAISVKLKIGKGHWGVASDATCGSDAGSCYPSDMGAYRQWVGDFVTRFDGRIRAYAIENEATASKFWDDDWFEYVSVWENATDSMRGNDSDVYIVDHGLPSSHLFFGWAYEMAQTRGWDVAYSLMLNWFSQRGLEWFTHRGVTIPQSGNDLQLLYQDPTTIDLLNEINSTFELQRDADAMQLHFYESWNLMPQLYDWIRGKMLETQGTTIPIEHWEAGFALYNHSLYDEQLMARNATKLLITSLGEGSGVVHWLPLYTNKPLRCENETHWGLWETVLDGPCNSGNINNVPHHFEARAAADSFTEVSSKLGQFNSVTAFSRGPSFYSYLFEGVASQAGGELWANWTSEEGVEWSDETYNSGNIVQSDCGYRRGGAMITFSMSGDNTTYQVTEWITNDAFIDEAIAIRDGQSARIPVFDQVVAGTGCDEQWSWHVDAKNVTWADLSTEVCDATPLYVENNRDAWISSPGNWCPWAVTGVLSVDLRDIETPRFGYSVQENVTYANGEVYTDGTHTTTTTIPLKLDVYLPLGSDAPSPRPVMVLFHGDNFNDGDKSDANQVAIAREFVTRGYVVLCANYRLQSDDPVADGNTATQRAMNAAVRDGRDAILWLGGNMSALDIDLNRVNVGGDSAGAYIATHLAYDNQLGVSDGIAGVLDLWGGLGDGNSNMMYDGESFIFIVHGDDDPYVPLQWSEDLVARAEQYSIPYEYHHFAGRGHGFSEIDLWNDTVEGLSLMERAIQFFASNLYQFGYGPVDVVNPITVNASDVIGRIAPIHGVNEGPLINMSYGINSDDPWRKACDLGHYTNANYTEPQMEANVPEGRWHPWGVSDMNRIWKPWPAFDGYDPTDADNYDFRALDATFLAADAAGINISWRAGHSKISEVDPDCGLGFNNPPENFTLWSQVVVQILKHYKSGWADGYQLDSVKNVEIWIEPYLHQWWNGADWEYYSLYAHANAAVTAEFGDSIPVIASLQANTNFTRNFLRLAQQNNTPIDAIDLHPYRIRPSKIDAMVWQDLDESDGENNSLEHMLIEYGYPRDTPIYFTEWHRSIGEYALSPGSQSFMTSALIEMNDLWIGNGEHGLEMAHSFMSMHFFWDEDTNNKKPLGWTWYVYGNWMIGDTPNRLSTTGSHWTSEPEAWIGQDLNVLAGSSDDREQVNVLISSYDNTDAAETGSGHPDQFSEYPTTIDLEVSDLPWGEGCSYSWERWTYRTQGLIKVGYGVGEGPEFAPPIHQMNSRSYEIFRFFLTDDDPACSTGGGDPPVFDEVFTVDAGSVVGAIAPIHGVNSGPLYDANNWSSNDPCNSLNIDADYSDHFNETLIPQSRNHDEGRVTDLTKIWKPWPAFAGYDANDPANYNFTQADDRISASMATEATTVLFRIGNERHHENAEALGCVDPRIPPDDNSVFAQVALNVIRHYREGWADGFEYDRIRDIEIWNEPYIQHFWSGNVQDYFDMYNAAYASLKGHFGDDITVIASLNNQAFGEMFLSLAQNSSSPIEAVSLHLYKHRPYDILDAVYLGERAFEDLLAGYGYPRQTPLYITEWNRMTNHYASSPASQAFLASSLAYFNDMYTENGQHSVAQAHYYAARSQMWFEDNSYKHPGATWKAYGDWLYSQTPVRLDATGGHFSGGDYGEDVTILAGKSLESDAVHLMISNYENFADAAAGGRWPDQFGSLENVSLTVDNLPWGDCEYSWERWSHGTQGLEVVDGGSSSGQKLDLAYQMAINSYDFIKITLVDTSLECQPPSPSDADGDGVDDEIDLCPDTPLGAVVNSDGCAESQLDDDGDGVMNDSDLCPNTPQGAVVNSEGCAASQLDDDGDGVMNDSDLCPDTPQGAVVDSEGCEVVNPPPDADGDGVADEDDLCPDTPSGALVDLDGCSRSQLDYDGDGVMNDVDICPNTPVGTTVDSTGCAIDTEPSDSDGDGVNDDDDQCPNTPSGDSVDSTGCTLAPSGGGKGGISTTTIAVVGIAVVILLLSAYLITGRD